jgi:sulfur carrier protein
MQLIINGKSCDFESANLSVADLVSALKLESKRLAVEWNGEIVPRSRFFETQLSDGDKLEIVGAVGGG